MKFIFKTPAYNTRRALYIKKQVVFYSKCYICKDDCSKLKDMSDFAAVIHMSNVNPEFEEGLKDYMIPVKNPEGLMERLIKEGAIRDNYSLS